MATILIVIHLLVVIALVGLILMQRSEGGGLGIGGGAGFMSARGAANALTRTTAILAVAFFATSLGLSLLARYQGQPTDIFDRLPQETLPQDGGGAGILDELGGGTTAPAPAESAPADSEGSVPSPAEEAAPSAPEEGQATPESQVPTGQ
ncbi:preprotein translocase subunit SecG [Chelativorans sp. SCAU2101]|jgi:protein translocase, SecG subunit|uniref:Protein-export membrane protein SecG n=1 Tax=Chelativorans petroleitrophicus TaxID=2975484 RepID=A0A9X3BAC2_9HYPH|nr:preprotein translocase subunit SecG [Chelativorans petroleitrophicus]MCT8991746.1 preprotein translocase subunit SecG [Chelativorans petroleitrophicus]